MALFTVTNSPGTVSFTAFSVSSTTGYACISPDLSPYDTTYYHDGAGAYPTAGDTVYTDSGGLTVAQVYNPDHRQMGNLDYLQTSVLGITESVTCK